MPLPGSLLRPQLIVPLYVILVSLSFVSARSLAALLLVLAVLGLAGVAMQTGRLATISLDSAVDYSIITFLAWALLSAAWAQAPDAAIAKAGGALIVYFAVKVLIASVVASDLEIRKAVGTAIVLAVLVAGSILAIDVLSKRTLSLWFVNQSDAVSDWFGLHIWRKDGSVFGMTDAGINRTMAAISLLAVPTFVGISRLAGGALKTVLIAWLLSILLVFLWRGTHQSSQLALVMAALAAFGWIVTRGRIRPLILAALVLLPVLMMPLATAANQLGLQESKWLFSSARSRIVIWGAVAAETREHPFIGRGVESSALLMLAREDVNRLPGAKRYSSQVEISHAHNAYLQLWYELGGVGIALLMMLVVSLWRSLVSAGKPNAIARTAHIVLVAAIIASSYGIWQIWFLSGIALSVWAHALFESLPLATGKVEAA